MCAAGDAVSADSDAIFFLEALLLTVGAALSLVLGAFAGSLLYRKMRPEIPPEDQKGPGQ
jgi:hypothetical protein